MSPEGLECDLPSWSCQTSPQPDPRPPLMGKLRRTPGQGVLGRAVPRHASEVSRPSPDASPRAQDTRVGLRRGGLRQHAPCSGCRGEGLMAPRLTSMPARHLGSAHGDTDPGPREPRAGRKQLPQSCPPSGQPQNRGGSGWLGHLGRGREPVTEASVVSLGLALAFRVGLQRGVWGRRRGRAGCRDTGTTARGSAWWARAGLASGSVLSAGLTHVPRDHHRRGACCPRNGPWLSLCTPGAYGAPLVPGSAAEPAWPGAWASSLVMERGSREREVSPTGTHTAF